MKQEFFISTIPIGQARPKFARIGNHVHAYDPAKSRGYKLYIKNQIMDKNPARMEGPLTLIVDFLMPRPQAHYGKKGLKDSAPYYCTTKPDLDNLIKAVKDAITNTGMIWKDDSYVCVEMASKKYSEVPGIKIIIQECK